MNKSFSQQMQDVAKYLVQDFGSKATYIQQKEKDFDPVSGGDSETEEKEYDILISPPQNYKKNEVDQSLIKEGDFKVFITDVTFTPYEETDNTVDKLEYNGVKYRVVSVKNVSLPANMTGGWELQLRK